MEMKNDLKEYSDSNNKKICASCDCNKQRLNSKECGSSRRVSIKVNGHHSRYIFGENFEDDK